MSLHTHENARPEERTPNRMNQQAMLDVLLDVVKAQIQVLHQGAALQDVFQEISSVLKHYQADLAANKLKEKEVIHITE